MGVPLTLRVQNRFDFLDLSGVAMRAMVTALDSAVATAEMDQLRIPPHDWVEMEITLPDFPVQDGQEYFLALEFYLREDRGLLSAGHVPAWEQFRLPLEPPPSGPRVEKTGKITYRVHGSKLVPDGEAADFRTTFDLEKGELESHSYGGAEVIRRGPRSNFWRPPTDNDYGNAMPRRHGVWKAASRNQPVLEVEHWQNSDRDTEVRVTVALPEIQGWHTTHYQVFGTGEVVVSTELHPGDMRLPSLPKYGMTLTLPGV